MNAIVSLVSLLMVSADEETYERLQAASIEVLVDNHLAGSGWIADAKGLAFTAAHVATRKQADVRSPKLGRLKAEVIAVDLAHDLALLRLPERDAPYPSLPVARKPPAPGARLFIMGAPLYRHHVMLHGRLARKKTTYEWLPDQKLYVRALLISGFSPPGASGGPWVNAAGAVVGLQSGAIGRGSNGEGLAFAAPHDAIRRLLQTRKSPAVPTFGAAVEELWEQPGNYLKKFPARAEGVRIRSPQQKGPAARAGLNEDDVIVAVDGRPVPLRDDFLGHVFGARPGDTIRLDVLRAGDPKPRKVDLKLGARKRR